MFGWLQNLIPPQNVSGPLLTTYLLFDVFLIVVLARRLRNLMTRQFQIITNLTFTIIVIVALVTNLMTVPLLNLFSSRQLEPPIANSAVQDL